MHSSSAWAFCVHCIVFQSTRLGDCCFRLRCGRIARFGILFTAERIPKEANSHFGLGVLRFHLLGYFLDYVSPRSITLNSAGASVISWNRNSTVNLRSSELA